MTEETMAKKTFPKMLHVTVEEIANGERDLIAHEDGVQSIDKHWTPCAVYRLVEVGNVQILRNLAVRRPIRRKGC